MTAPTLTPLNPDVPPDVSLGVDYGSRPPTFVLHRSQRHADGSWTESHDYALLASAYRTMQRANRKARTARKRRRGWA